MATMIPTAVDYKDLNSKQRETFNFHTVAALLAQRGYDSMRFHDDWAGADFIAVHVDGHVRRVQLKARISIAVKYDGKGIDMVFPIEQAAGKVWYLIPHDELKALIGEHAPSWLLSKSWTNADGYYDSAAPSAALVAALAPYRLS